VPASKLDVIGQSAIHDLYREMLKVSPGLTPPVVDQLEIAVCASLLGVESSGGPRDYTAERAAAIREGRKPPLPEPVDISALGLSGG
jgi:hypothetical protein